MIFSLSSNNPQKVIKNDVKRVLMNNRIIGNTLNNNTKLYKCMMADKTVTSSQIKKIQTLFSQMGFEKDEKMDVISRLTNGRATSTKDLTLDEAKYLIKYLIGDTGENKAHQEKCKSVVKCIYRLSYDIGMSYGDTPEDKLMNCAKINKFCRERGTVKKNISEMTLTELQKTRKQFEAILSNNLDNSVKQLVKKSVQTLKQK